ncbi:MAG: ferrous iron transport protein B [Oscillospiraceae bacterium]
MPITIALAGNPNSGKTTMFNDLTGSSQYVGNWPGVTVEKKEGKLRGYKEVSVMDLPGIYSLSPYTLEEVVTRDYLIKEQPDVIINLVDASNIERNLYLTTQLMEMGLPVIIALNMMDVVKKNGDTINVKELSHRLGCQIVETAAVKGEGLKELAEKAVALAEKHAAPPVPAQFHGEVEKALAEIDGRLPSSVPQNQRRWFSVKLFEGDGKATEGLGLSTNATTEIAAIVAACEETQEDDAESIITSERYDFIGGVVAGSVKKKAVGMTTSDKIDRIVTNRWLALPIFAAVMFIVYFVSVSWLGAIVTDWTNDTLFGEWIQPGVTGLLEGAGASEWVVGLIVDGFIGGVGAVLGFVPQMMILFLFLAFLEDCGYMARVAFIMDRIFRKFGLSGKSFIPMLISSGCGVPGIMASRTIENEKDRRMTVMVTTFIPCGAKLPIIALIGGAMFGGSPWIAPAMYFLGVFAVIISGIILKKTKLFAGDPAPFVMELPQYRLPSVKGMLIHMWERSKAFIIKAGTIIFLAAGVIWFLSNFGFGPDGFGMMDQDASMLAAVGNFIAPVFAPLGFGNWQAAVATITGLLAKETVVATFGVLFGLGELAEDDPTLLLKIGEIFTAISALSFMIFNLLCAPCFAAIGAAKQELGTKWMFICVGYQCLLAYALSFIVYQLGSVFMGTMAFGVGPVIAILLVLAILYLLFRPGTNGSGKKRGAAQKAGA